MDAKLKYKEHIARAASKGLEAAMELRRLRGLSPSTARQLFTSTVAPVVDYASNVWMHAFKDKLVGPINRVQRIGAQAIVGTFLTVATSIAEIEAYIASTQDRFWKRAVELWTDIHTLPDTNPLRRNTSRMRKFRRQHRSPLYQVADALKDIAMEELETINPFTLAPWEKRVQTITDETAAGQADTGWAVRITVSSTDPWSPGKYSRTSYEPVAPPCSWSWSTLSKTSSQSALSGHSRTSPTTILRSSSSLRTRFLLLSGIWPSGILFAQPARLCLSRSSDLPSSQKTELNVAWWRRAKPAASCVFPMPPSP